MSSFRHLKEIRMEKETADVFVEKFELPKDTIVKFTSKFAHFPLILPSLLKLIVCENLVIRQELQCLLELVFNNK